MRFFLKATMPVKAGNALLRDPEMGSKMESLMGDLKPEAAYFCIEGGQRTAYFVVNMENAEEMPRLAEPLWLSWEADVELIPIMTGEDLEKGLAVMPEILQKY